MNSLIERNHCKLFYILWGLLGIFQAASTQLIDDEAYYWVYSRFLDWGYFDHPPLTALLIKLGYTVFPNELGVRLLSVLLNVLTILLLENLTERKNPFLFYGIALSIASFQVIGFLAVPDNALLFFTALFFYSYKKFLKHSSLSSALFLGLVTALLLYTKYHGLLIVFFTFLSNPTLLSKSRTWIAAFFALFLFAPHLYWQWQNDWVSFRYHLFESNVDPYRISFTTDYLLGQLLLAGPLAGLLLLPAAFLYKPQNKTDLALKFTMIGVYTLFFISSFRGRVEANWPAPALIPLFILSYQYINIQKKLASPLRVITLITLVMMMAGRVYMIMDIGPDNAVKKRFHAAKKWVHKLNEKTGSYPVVFNASYQKASQFWFYTGKPSHNTHYYLSRRSNYNFWPTDLNLIGKAVFCATGDTRVCRVDSVFADNTWLYLLFDSSYASLGKVTINPDKAHYSIKKGEAWRLVLQTKFPYPYDSILASNPGLQARLYMGIKKDGKNLKDIETGIPAQELLNKAVLKVNIDTRDLPPGNYICRLGIRVKNHHPAHNSMKIKLTVE